MFDYKRYIESRGVSPEVADRFNLGFQDSSGKRYVYGSKFKLWEPVPSFSNSLIFPIKDLRGDINFYAGRKVLGETDQKFYFQKNSKKSGYIYGLYEALPYIIQSGYVILVEGFFDVLVLHSFGFKNTVSCMGTGVSTSQILTLLLFTNKFIVAFDNDFGGNSGILQLSKKQKDYSFKMKVIYLPDNMDPDEYILKYGREAWRNKLIEKPGNN